MPKQEYSKQEKYLWHLVRTAGWDKKVAGAEHSRFDQYILKTFGATHVAALRPDEMRKAITTMKRYAEKSKVDHGKKLRQTIMAYVAKNGKDREWLHEQMTSWGAGDSLRALGVAELLTVHEAVKKCFNN